jgi:hypothetical protein
VNVIFLVTAIAIQRSLTVFLAHDVALIALHPVVLAPELKVGLGVVKFLFIQINHVRITPFVVGVARTACWISDAAMESAFVAHIGPHIFMARHTKAVLCFAVKFNVALFAVVL